MKILGQFKKNISNNSIYFHNLLQLIHCIHFLNWLILSYTKHFLFLKLLQKINNLEKTFLSKKPCIIFFFTLTSSLSLILSLSLTPSLSLSLSSGPLELEHYLQDWFSTFVCMCSKTQKSQDLSPKNHFIYITCFVCWITSQINRIWLRLSCVPWFPGTVCPFVRI